MTASFGSGCKPVSATWTPTSPTVGQVVTFSGTASGTPLITYDWTFGDGGTGSGQSVTHTYTAAGTYTVTMVATNACGSQTVTHDITVQAAPAYSLHIYRNALTSKVRRGTYTFTDEVTVHDQAHALAASAKVYGTWTLPGGATLPSTATTNSKGWATFAYSSQTTAPTHSA